MSEKQIHLENALDSVINALFERFDEIAAQHDADGNEICYAVAEFGGQDLAEIYRDWIAENWERDDGADEPDPDVVRDRIIAEELEGQD